MVRINAKFGETAAAAVLAMAAVSELAMVEASPLYFAGIELGSRLQLRQHGRRRTNVAPSAVPLETAAPSALHSRLRVTSSSSRSSTVRRKKRAGVCTRKATTTAQASPTAGTTTTTTTTVTKGSIPTATATTSSYKLVDNFEGDTFFDGWNFWAHDDPTHGTVAYQNRTSATAAGLAYVNSAGQAILKVDSTNDYAENVGRPSVRLHSKNTYATGLAILDVEHMPVGCSVWPAWWMDGPSWPDGGEVDFLEGVGDGNVNTVSLHTSAGCTVSGPSASNNFTGTLLRDNCDAYNQPQGGCSISDTFNTTLRPNYGSGFNANKGGLYVAQFEDSGVRVWVLHRDSIPSDVLAGQPNPESPEWPLPVAIFSTESCEYKKYFGQQTIIINTTLGGDWGCGTYGQKYTSQASCPGTCTERIMKGDNFKDAYWVVNSMKMYGRQ